MPKRFLDGLGQGCVGFLHQLVVTAFGETHLDLL